MWECSKCLEQSEDNFDACWNCGTYRDGTPNPDFEPPEEAQGDAGADEIRAEPAPQSYSSAPELACRRCGCNEVIPNARVLDYYDTGVSDAAQVEVRANPDAWFFTGARTSPLRAQVCGRCGHVELFVEQPEYLLEAYRKSQQ